MSGVKVRMRHALMLGHCREGIRRHLEAAGWSVADLAGPHAPGIDSDEMKRRGSPQMREVAELAERLAQEAGGADGQEEA